MRERERKREREREIGRERGRVERGGKKGPERKGDRYDGSVDICRYIDRRIERVCDGWRVSSKNG